MAQNERRFAIQVMMPKEDNQPMRAISLPVSCAADFVELF